MLSIILMDFAIDVRKTNTIGSGILHVGKVELGRQQTFYLTFIR